MLGRVTATILKVTFDCLDSESVAGFWSAVTGWPRSFQDMPGQPLLGGRPGR
jgi:hypothetical protein